MQAAATSPRPRPEFDSIAETVESIAPYSGAEFTRMTSAPTVETRTVSIAGREVASVFEFGPGDGDGERGVDGGAVRVLVGPFVGEDVVGRASRKCSRIGKALP